MVHVTTRQGATKTVAPSPAFHRVNKPMISARASVLKCRLNPTTAADGSAVTSQPRFPPAISTTALPYP